MVGKFCQMSNAWALEKHLNGISYSMGEVKSQATLRSIIERLKYN